MGLWGHMEAGGRRAVAIWHRRAGKDSVAVNWGAVAAHQEIGTYWHMLPEAQQARKVIWDGIGMDGQRFIDQAFPADIRASTNATEMKITLRCGSIWQAVGSDNYNSLIGANPRGVVFSEYSVAKPGAWDYIRPILAENGGWAIFIYTPRGKNHGKRLYDMASKNDGWFAEVLTVDDTGILSPQVIAEERSSGMSEELIQQEYYCAWEGSVEGAYYSREIAKARADGRITKIPHQVGVPVNTFWDLGANDTTAIWFHQQVAFQHRFLHAYEASGEGLSHYVGLLQRLSIERGFVYGRHFLPHDAEHKKLESMDNIDGRCTREILSSHGLSNLVVVPRVDDVTVGIDLTRQQLSQSYFDGENCERGIDALSQYHKQWDEHTQTFRRHPHHDWSSNYADAFRQFAQGWSQNSGAVYVRRPSASRSHRTV